MSAKHSKGRVLVAMSGGVDSSVAAALLVEQGYEVIGCTMQVWDYSKGSSCSTEEGVGTCCSSIDVDDAREVADRLKIPFYVINCEEAFEKYVIKDFVDSYLNGKTPIPCVNCNTFLKFDHLIKKMAELRCDYLATGHYAYLDKTESGKIALKTSADSWKDQTYFLFTMKSSLLPKLIFPVGHLTKTEVRSLAEERGLIVAKKKDSTGICFVGDRGYKSFLQENLPEGVVQEGLLKEWGTGKVLGTHQGVHNFTLGQRKGLGISSNQALYVVKIEADTQEVWLGEEKDLYSDSLVMVRPNWLGDFKEGETLKVKIRFSHPGAEAKISSISREVSGSEQSFKLHFLEPQRAITPGQAAVIYRGKELLGGGWIK